MSELDEELRPLASELLGEFGKSIAFNRRTTGAYNPATGTGSVFTVTTSLRALVEGASAFAPGRTVAMSDRKVTAAAADFATPPVPGDQLTIDSVAYTIAEDGVETVFSGELPCLFIIHARKG